jgi:hypothetical protein
MNENLFLNQCVRVIGNELAILPSSHPQVGENPFVLADCTKTQRLLQSKSHKHHRNKSIFFKLGKSKQAHRNIPKNHVLGLETLFFFFHVCS